VFLNLSLIGCAVWLAPHLPEPIRIHALAWGVFIAGVVQLAFQFPFLRRLRLVPRPRWGAAHDGVRRIMRLMLPALFGSSVAQVNILFDTLVASFLLTGSVSWLFYADRLLEFPLALLGIALGTVILPSLSRRHAENNVEEFNRTLDWALRWMVLVGVPSAVGLLMLAAPILITLFQYGKFGGYDARMAAAALTAYSVGLMGFLLVKVLTPAYYSRQDTRTPVRVGVVAMVSNMVMDVVFTVPLVKLGFWAPHAGLAAATAVSAFINSGLLLRGLRRQGVYRPLPGWRRLLFRVALANSAMGAVLWALGRDTGVWLAWGAGSRAGHLLLLVGAAVVTYFGVLWLLGVRPNFLLRRPAER
jgi:putative peptidoglycan lipid II flippase